MRWALGLVFAVGCGGLTAVAADAGIDGGSGGSATPGSGSSSGGFPFSGPSCTDPAVTPACWSCMQTNCPGAIECIGTTCSAFWTCWCACAAGDATCQATCGDCPQQNCSYGACINSLCPQACLVRGEGSDAGSDPTSTPTTTCTNIATAPCPNGEYLQSCSNYVYGGNCTSAWFQLGAQKFPCASCTNTGGCLQQVQAACQ